MNLDFYMNGAWQTPSEAKRYPIINPATEEPGADIPWGSADDVDLAVSAANVAFESWGCTTKSERQKALGRIISVYERRFEEMAQAISLEMGAPIDLSRNAQAASGIDHLKIFVESLDQMTFERPFYSDTPEQRIALEPAGVAALITPWNWPMNQICLKVGAALAAGCTMVLKPSEIAPLSGALFAEFIDEAGLPPGVFNLMHGGGATTGACLVTHPAVNVVSFTGSTRAGIAISKSAAETIKRVTLELGGKSPNIVFADCDLEARVRHGVKSCFTNTGQSCDAPTRMLVERLVYEQAIEIAADAARNTEVGLPGASGDHIGPLVSGVQFDKVQQLIGSGIDEGARLVVGGQGRPEGFNKGWFVRPTLFADVSQDMSIWKNEIFGPVLTMTPFDDEEHAIRLANDTPYGLAAYLQTKSAERAARVVPKLRAGIVRINGASRARGGPFGGYKQSGIGREGGVMGIEEFIEVKAVSGWLS